MAVGEIYNVKLNGSLQGKALLNVFNYQVGAEVGGSSNAVVLSNEFNTDVLPAIANIVTVDVAFSSIECFSWENPADSNIVPTGSLSAPAGVRLAPTMAAFQSWSYSLNRVSPGQRSGGKRFSGLAEADLDAYTPTAPALVLLGILAGAIASVLTEGFVTYFPWVARQPTILGFRPLGYQPASIQFSGVGSQVSRKLTLADQ